MRNPTQITLRTAAVLAAVVSTTLLGIAAAPVLAPQAAEVPLPSTLNSPKVYVFPMEGQMGTDISESLFKILKEDVNKQQPDIIVFKLKSADVNTNDYLKDDDANEFGILGEITAYREMVKGLREEFRKLPQVMWISDAVGVSSLYALAWPRMYMDSDARLGGLNQFKEMVAAQWEDDDVRSKMIAAWTGIMKGMSELGGYPVELADSMIFAENKLSVNFEGRSAKWLGDTSGTWVVDSNEGACASFRAQLAEDSMLSDGTADSLDDLMFLLGYREYVKIETGEKLAKQFSEEWRKAMKSCFENLEEAQETEDSVVGLGKRKSLYEKTIALLKRFPMIEKRRELAQRGVSLTALERAVDDIKKDIQRQRDAEKGGRQNGGGGGRGAGGGGAKGLGG